MKCYDESKIVNLKAEQLSEVSGGTYAYDTYRKYVQMVTSVARSDDYENRDVAEGILWCHSCGTHTKAENWVIN